jgi:predicted ABC-type ATPase
MMGDTTAVANPEVLITGGLPGSGKSTVLRMRGEEFTNHVHVDSDAIKARLPEYKGWNAGLLHEESSHVAGRLMEQSISGSRNVIYDATLKTQSSAHKIVDSFTDIGYKSKIVFVDAPMETAMNRAVSRFMGPSGRYVPLGYLATHDHKNAATVDSLKGKVDSWEHWDSSESPPKLVATGGK